MEIKMNEKEKILIQRLNIPVRRYKKYKNKKINGCLPGTIAT